MSKYRQIFRTTWEPNWKHYHKRQQQQTTINSNNGNTNNYSERPVSSAVKLISSWIPTLTLCAFGWYINAVKIRKLRDDKKRFGEVITCSCDAEQVTSVLNHILQGVICLRFCANIIIIADCSEETPHCQKFLKVRSAQLSSVESDSKHRAISQSLTSCLGL